MKILPILFAFFLFTSVSNAQSVKTEAAHRLADVEINLTQYQANIDQAKHQLQQLLTTKTEQHRDVVTLKAVIQELNSGLASLEEEKKVLNSKELVRPLPNNDVALLKVIAIQNERIIVLLERAARDRRQ